MAPSRKLSNPAPRAKTTPYETRARRTQDAGSSNKTSTGDIIKNEDTASDGDSSPTYAAARRSRTKGTKEFCTAQQSAALLAFFWRYKGFPGGTKIVKFAAIIKKSAHSVAVWVNNHRHPRLIKNTPWFYIPGAIDPEIDPSASYYPHNPSKRPFDKNADLLEDAVGAFDAHPYQPTARVALAKSLKAGCKKGRKVKASKGKSGSTRASPSISSEAPEDIGTSSSSTGSPPPIPIISQTRSVAHSSVSPESSCSLGDSNGSAASSPRSSPPAPAGTKPPPTQTEIWIAEALLEMSALKIDSRPSVPVTATNKPGIREYDQEYAIQQPSFGPIRNQSLSSSHLRNDTQMHAWRVANPYGRLPGAAKREYKTTKLVRFADVDDIEPVAGLPSMHISQERAVSNTPQPVVNGPSRRSCSSPSQELHAPRITHIPLPCSCPPALPQGPITSCQDTQVPHIGKPSQTSFTFDSTPSSYNGRVSATASYAEPAFAPYDPFDVAQYQDSNYRPSMGSEEGDTTDEEDMETVAPLCSFPGGIYGPCRLSRDVARPAGR